MLKNQEIHFVLILFMTHTHIRTHTHTRIFICELHIIFYDFLQRESPWIFFTDHDEKCFFFYYKREVQTNSAIITISPTILALAQKTETLLTNEYEFSAEMSKNKNSINPYNREPGRIIGVTSPELDYRYSLVNAMSAVKSSYLRSDCTNAKIATNEPQRSDTEGKSVGDEWAKYETFKKIKNKVEEAIKVSSFASSHCTNQ